MVAKHKNKSANSGSFQRLFAQLWKQRFDREFYLDGKEASAIFKIHQRLKGDEEVFTRALRWFFDKKGEFYSGHAPSLLLNRWNAFLEHDGNKSNIPMLPESPPQWIRPTQLISMGFRLIDKLDIYRHPKLDWDYSRFGEYRGRSHQRCADDTYDTSVGKINTTKSKWDWLQNTVVNKQISEYAEKHLTWPNDTLIDRWVKQLPDKLTARLKKRHQQGHRLTADRVNHTRWQKFPNLANN
jgi:hypothetical protein